MEDFLSSFFANFETFLNLAGSDPFSAMWFIFLKGGWILVAITLIWAAKEMWMDTKQGRFINSRVWINLRITVPNISEQTPKAAENLFAQIAGAHASLSWTEIYMEGAMQTVISMEMECVEGRVSYYVHCLKKNHALIESAIFAQYPDAEIELVEDYTNWGPKEFPNDEYEAWGAEWIAVNKKPYSLKTYRDFEDQVSGELKDPMATLLEVLSRLGPNEHAWYQITCTPTDAPKARADCEKLIDKLKGVKVEPKKTILDSLISFPITLTGEVFKVLVGSAEAPKKKPEAKDEKFPRMMALSPGERDVLEAVERKGSKILYDCKVRIIYVAKKDIMKKSKIANPFIGAIKQTNTGNMQSLKPESKRVGVNGNLWWFKDRRNNIRKSHLIKAYRGRSNWRGMPNFYLSTEELATLWHFPILMQVKAPQLLRTQAKKAEPPANLPYGM